MRDELNIGQSRDMTALLCRCVIVTECELVEWAAAER